jgi:hypothetical protein
MSKKFQVIVKATIERVIEVEAEDSADAIAKAETIANTPNTQFELDADSEWEATEVREQHEQKDFD